MEHYTNRELDGQHQAILDKIDNLRNVLELRMGTFENDTRNSLSRIETQVSYTNGKVRRITVILVFVIGLVVGLGFVDVRSILPLLGL